MTTAILCTPRCVEKIYENNKFTIEKIKEKFKAKDIKILPTVEIYMNTLDPRWTEEMCDNTVYVIPDYEKWLENNNKNKIGFSF